MDRIASHMPETNLGVNEETRKLANDTQGPSVRYTGPLKQVIERTGDYSRQGSAGAQGNVRILRPWEHGSRCFFFLLPRILFSLVVLFLFSGVLTYWRVVLT
jgi:hypothetical protein